MSEQYSVQDLRVDPLLNSHDGVNAHEILTFEGFDRDKTLPVPAGYARIMSAEVERNILLDQKFDGQTGAPIWNEVAAVNEVHVTTKPFNWVSGIFRAIGTIVAIQGARHLIKEVGYASAIQIIMRSQADRLATSIGEVIHDTLPAVPVKSVREAGLKIIDSFSPFTPQQANIYLGVTALVTAFAVGYTLNNLNWFYESVFRRKTYEQKRVTYSRPARKRP